MCSSDLYEIIKIAKILKVKKISYGSSYLRKLNNNSNSLILNHIVLRRLCEMAYKINTDVFLEPINIKYHNYFLQNIAEVCKNIDKMNISNLNFLLDTGNLMSSKINIKKFFKIHKKKNACVMASMKVNKKTVNRWGIYSKKSLINKKSFINKFYNHLFHYFHINIVTSLFPVKSCRVHTLIPLSSIGQQPQSDLNHPEEQLLKYRRSL